MSDDTPTGEQYPTPQETPCDYVVESVNTQSRVAQVKFINPYYSGKFIVEDKVLIAKDPNNSDTDGKAKYTTKMVDKDPNPHLTKSVNVPFGESGPDLEAFKEICTQQARGARSRIEAAYARSLASASAPDLSGLVGLTNKSAAATPNA
jgi:hypothetical protein